MCSSGEFNIPEHKYNQVYIQGVPEDIPTSRRGEPPHGQKPVYP